MDDESMKQEITRPIGGALTGMEWFVLFAFIDFAVNKEEMFVSEDDRTNFVNTARRLHDQVFPPKKDNSEEFADVVLLKPKKIVTKDFLL